MYTDFNRVDCAIVGAGPAGLAAAMQLARMGISHALFERASPGGQALAANWIENFPGLPEGISGRELMRKFLDQAGSHGVRIELGDVVRVDKHLEGFLLSADGHRIAASSLVVAAGLTPRRLDIEGEQALAGRRFFAYVDPATVPHAGIEVVVIGDGDAAFDQALSYSKNARSVSIAMKHDSPRCTQALERRVRDAGITVLPSHIARRLEERGDRAVITFECGDRETTIEARLVVACAGKERKLDFLPYALQEPDARGVFMAGDCRIGRMGHVAIAAGEGIKAAIDAAEYLRTNGNHLQTGRS